MHTTNPFRRAHDSRQEQQRSEGTRSVAAPSADFQPPSGPPPSWNGGEIHRPPPGPPPSWKGDEAIAPPSGPPPSHRGDEAIAPPHGPPPSRKGDDAAPPPYAPWMQVPDNSSLPPPPSLGYDVSPTANASFESAESARKWCNAYPLYAPRQPTQTEGEAIARGYNQLLKNPTMNGTVRSPRPGTHVVQSRSGCQDSLVLTQLPLYFASLHWPQNHETRTIYYEIRVLKMGGDSYSSTSEADAGIALGFLAPPYPAWRLPGWERASLGVHGDDGRRFVNDNGGGKDFTTSFNVGEVIGIGMVFKPQSHANQPLDVDVFLTRDGRKVGGWNLFEERDAVNDGDVGGLDGRNDLLGAVGFFGQVEFEVRFHRDEWLFRP